MQHKSLSHQSCVDGPSLKPEASPCECANLSKRLGDLSRSLSAISAELEALNTSSPYSEAEVRPPLFSRIISEFEYARLAQRAYQSRRKRVVIFDDHSLFGEPAWDILLDLFIAACQGKRVAVTSACIGADAPSTTALRWLNVLQHKGLIARETDDQDGRRTFVRLSELGLHRMREYFSQTPIEGKVD